MSGTDVGELHYDYYPADPKPEPAAAAAAAPDAGATAMET
jgi:hypothetical protein